MAMTKKNSTIKTTLEDSINDAAHGIQDRAGKSIDSLINRLKYERDGLERELKHEYRNVRRQVRANPEVGIGIAFAAGLTLGVLLTLSAKD